MLIIKHTQATIQVVYFDLQIILINYSTSLYLLDVLSWLSSTSSLLTRDSHLVISFLIP